MPDIISIPGPGGKPQVMTEDGKGGWRAATLQEMKDANISFPPAVTEDIARRVAEQKEQVEAQGIRTGKVKPGESPKLPIQEMIPGTPRFSMRTFLEDPKLYQTVLESHGFEVEPYGGAFNFAYKRPGQPWHVFDPIFGKGGVYEPVKDMMDLLGDAAAGFITSAAAAGGMAVGGPVGAATAAAGTGAALEAGREKMGRMIFGLSNALNTQTIATMGAASAAPEILSLLKPVVKGGVGKFADGALEMSSKVTGIPKEAMIARAKRPGFGRLTNSLEAAKRVRATMKSFTDDLIPEKREAMTIIKEASDKGATVDVTPVLEDLLSRIPEQGGVGAALKEVGSQGTLGPAAAANYSRIKALLSAAKVPPNEVPLELAEKLKQELQAAGKGKHVYDKNGNMIEMLSDVEKMFRDVAAITRAQVERSADASGLISPTGRKYSDLMAKVSADMDTIAQFNAAFNRGKGKGVVAEIKRTENARNLINKLHKDSGRQYLDVLENVDRLVGSNLKDLAEEAATGAAFGGEGYVPYVPRFTASGAILGPSVIGGAALAGHPMLAAGLAAGASPRAQITAIRLAQSAQKATERFSAMARPVTGTIPGLSSQRMMLQEAIKIAFAREVTGSTTYQGAPFAE